MPSYASKADAHADKITGEWIQIADSEVDDIGAWRYTPAEVRISRCVPDKQHYSSGGWPTLPKEFFGYTQHLVGLIAADYPLEPKPISDIYDAVAAWHHDHNAARVPPQNELYSQLEQAVIVVTAVQAAIYGRVVPSSKVRFDLPSLNESQQAALDYIKENGPVGGKMVADHVHVEFETFRQWVVKLTAHGVRNKRDGQGYVYQPSM